MFNSMVGHSHQKAFRASLRQGEKAYDLVICDDRVRMTTAHRVNTGICSGKRIWSPAHTKKSISQSTLRKLTIINLTGKRKVGGILRAVRFAVQE